MSARAKNRPQTLEKGFVVKMNNESLNLTAATHASGGNVGQCPDLLDADNVTRGIDVIWKDLLVGIQVLAGTGWAAFSFRGNGLRIPLADIPRRPL